MGPIAAVDLLTIDPGSQNQSVGRRLMLTALECATKRRIAGVRLAQSADH
jgi:GNAT superfamily N-acetyltransferase